MDTLNTRFLGTPAHMPMHIYTHTTAKISFSFGHNVFLSRHKTHTHIIKLYTQSILFFLVVVLSFVCHFAASYRTRVWYTIHIRTLSTFQKMTLIDFYVSPAKKMGYLHSRAPKLYHLGSIYIGAKIVIQSDLHIGHSRCENRLIFPFEKCYVQSQPILKYQSNHTKNASYYNQIRCFIYMLRNEKERERRRRHADREKKIRIERKNKGQCPAHRNLLRFSHILFHPSLTNSLVGYFVEH